MFGLFRKGWTDIWFFFLKVLKCIFRFYKSVQAGGVFFFF